MHASTQLQPPPRVMSNIWRARSADRCCVVRQLNAHGVQCVKRRPRARSAARCPPACSYWHGAAPAVQPEAAGRGRLAVAACMLLFVLGRRHPCCEPMQSVAGPWPRSSMRRGHIASIGEHLRSSQISTHSICKGDRGYPSCVQLADARGDHLHGGLRR